MKSIIFKSTLIEYSIRVYELTISIFFIILDHTLISGIILILLNHKYTLTIILTT
jgi:hypothetical protein